MQFFVKSLSDRMTSEVNFEYKQPPVACRTFHPPRMRSGTPWLWHEHCRSRNDNPHSTSTSSSLWFRLVGAPWSTHRTAVVFAIVANSSTILLPWTRREWVELDANLTNRSNSLVTCSTDSTGISQFCPYCWAWFRAYELHNSQANTHYCLMYE